MLVALVVAAALYVGRDSIGRFAAQWLPIEASKITEEPAAATQNPAPPKVDQKLSASELATIREAFERDYLRLTDDSEQIELIRRELLDEIWRDGNPLPTDLACATTRITDRSQLAPLPEVIALVRGVSAVTRFDITMPSTLGNFHSYEYLCQPLNRDVRRNRLMIVHQGHARPGQNGTDTLALHLLARGYDVLLCDMPISGENTGPAVIVEVGEKLNVGCGHAGMAELESANCNPLKYFVDHISTGIAQAETINGMYDDISICGISGGGFTATLYAALDPRIKHSFSIAGLLPHALLPHTSEHVWNEAGQDQSIFEICPIHMMYVLAATGGNSPRHFALMHIEHDAIGVRLGAGAGATFLRAATRASMAGGGQFSFDFDEKSRQHRIGAKQTAAMFSILEGQYEPSLEPLDLPERGA